MAAAGRRPDRAPAGAAADEAAAEALRRAGCRVLLRNARTPAGEIDVVAYPFFAAKPRAVVIILQKLTRTMPEAPVISGHTSDVLIDGMRSAGKPAGTAPTTATPCRSNPSR